jgi:hypothetical protein
MDYPPEMADPTPKLPPDWLRPADMRQADYRIRRNGPPLWKVMRDAYDRSEAPPGAIWEDEHGYAAELRAIAEEIETRYRATPLMMRVGAEDIAKMLRAEADRAEAGE